MKQDEKALALFQEIRNKISAKEINWEAAAQDDHFIAPLGGKFKLKFWNFSFEDDSGIRRGGPSLTLNDDSNHLLVDMTTEVVGITSVELASLYQTVSRQVLKVDEKIDEAIALLRKSK